MSPGRRCSVNTRIIEQHDKLVDFPFWWAIYTFGARLFQAIVMHLIVGDAVSWSLPYLIKSS